MFKASTFFPTIPEVLWPILYIYFGLRNNIAEQCVNTYQSSNCNGLASLVAIRFLQKLAQQPWSHGGYWLVELVLNSNLFVPMLRKRSVRLWDRKGFFGGLGTWANSDRSQEELNRIDSYIYLDSDLDSKWELVWSFGQGHNFGSNQNQTQI